MVKKWWASAPSNWKQQAELNDRLKKQREDEAAFNGTLDTPSSLSQMLRTGRVLPSQSRTVAPPKTGQPSPTQGGFTVTRASQPSQPVEQPGNQDVLGAIGRSLKAGLAPQTFAGTAKGAGQQIVESVAASHPEWRPGLQERGLVPSETPSVGEQTGQMLAAFGGFQGKAISPEVLAEQPWLALGPEAQIAGDIALKAAGPVARQIGQGVKGYPKKLVETAPRVVPERVTMAKKAPASLPKELKGAKPRYNIGNKAFMPVFDSDVDMSLFIVAQKTPSKSDAAYMAWLKEQFPQASESEIRSLGANVRARIKDIAKGSEEGNIRIADTRVKPSPVTQTASDLAAKGAESLMVKPTVKELQTKLAGQLAEVERGQIEQAAKNPYFEELMVSSRKTPKEQESLRARILARRDELLSEPAAESVGAKGAVPTVPPSPARAPQGITDFAWQKLTPDQRAAYIKAGGKAPSAVTQAVPVVESPFAVPRVNTAIEKRLPLRESLTGPKVNPNVKKVLPTRIPDEAPSIEGVGFPEREAPLTVEGAGEGAMPPFGPESGPPVPKKGRVPLWQQAEAGQPPPSGKPPVTEQVPSSLPSGRQPGGIGKMQPSEPIDDWQLLENAVNPAEPGFKDKVTAGAERFMELIPDRVNPLRELGATGNQAYELARLVPGSTSHGQEIIRRYFETIYQSVGKGLPDLEKYMVLMRNQDLLVRNPSVRLPGGVTGWKGTLENINKLKAQLGPTKFKEIESAATKLWEANDLHVLKPLLDEGILDQETYMAIKSAHPHYIPFKRADFVDTIGRAFTTPEASVSKTGIAKMQIEGSDLALSNPLARILSGPIRTQNYIARNRAAKAIVKSLTDLEKQTGEQLVTWIEPKGEMRLRTKVTGETFNRAKKAKHSASRETISYFENGKKVTAEVPALYARVAKSMDKEPSNLLSKILLTASAPLRHGAVTYNPAFVVVNLLRDSTTAFWKERLFPLSDDYLRGLIAVIKKNELYQEAAESNLFMSGMVETQKSARKLAKVHSGRMLGEIPVNNPVDALLILPRLVEQANLIAEKTTRVATFGKLRKQGVSRVEAALRARDVTVDFAKSGTAMQVINQIVPFSNAGLQGAINTASVIKNNPKWALTAGGIFITPTILSRVNNMRFETSKDIPDYEYTNNWVIQVAEGTKKSDGTKFPIYIKIPKGPIAGPLTFPAEALFHLTRQDNDRSVVEMVLSTGTEALKSTSPIDPSIAGILPPVAQTLAGLGTGRDVWQGRDIIPQGEQALLPEQQFSQDTSETAVALGQKFNVSPRMIEFAIKDYTAGTGGTALWMLDLGLGALGYSPEPYKGKEERTAVEEVKGAPVAGRFIGAKGTQQEIRGYENLDKITESSNRAFNALPEVNSLGVRLGQVGDTIEKTELTPQQRADYQKLMAEVVTPGVKAVLSSDEYKKMPKDKKLETIQKEMSNLKDIAREQFLRTLPPEQLTPEAQKYLGKQEASRTLKPYFDIPDQVMAQMGNRKVKLDSGGFTTIKMYMELTDQLDQQAEDAAKAGDLVARDKYLVAAKARKAGNVYKAVSAEVTRLKNEYRKAHPEADALLYTWYGLTPKWKYQQQTPQPVVPTQSLATAQTLVR